jgi:hypothetical protein
MTPIAQTSSSLISVGRPTTKSIDEFDGHLLQRFKDRLLVDKSLSRSLVSFQANKSRVAYRWYKYKEAFSAPPDFAEKLGFNVEQILVLPDGKGNSSQQMGEHGREVLWKCVYVWRKK